MCTCIGMIYFVTFLLLVTLPCWFVARILLFIACLCPAFLPTCHYCTKVIMGWAWWICLKLCCCFLRIRYDDIDVMNRSLAEAHGKPRLLMMNHTSFMDALCCATLLKASIGGNLKAFAAGHLFAMPFLGGISIASGHFKIPFKTTATKKEGEEAGGSAADFSVDKDAVAKSQEEFNDWVRTGHIGGWFPEGRLNPNPDVIQQFRAGGCKVAAENDCQIWCICFAGFEVFWNRKALVGGAPANCIVKAFKLCDSSSALIKELSKGDDSIDEKQKSLLIANHAQFKFQEARDKQNADPWVSKLPAEPVNGTALVEKGEAKS